MALKSSENLLETPNNPLIKYGGLSDSSILNTMNVNLRTDLLMLYDYADTIDSWVTKSNAMYVMQASTLASKIAALSGSITQLLATVAQSSKSTVISMYDTECRVTPLGGSTTSATVDTKYGQATLAVNNTTPKITVEDANGDIWIPETVKVGYCYKTAGTTPPQDYEYTIPTEHPYALDGKNETAWVEKAETVSDVWVKITLPVEVYTNDYINSIVVHPFPAMTQNLKGIYYRPYGSTWIACDLSYQPGYSSSKVLNYGNTRVIFAPSKASDILIHLELIDISNLYWGFSNIEANYMEFATASKLTINLTPIVGAGTISSPTYTLRGKDESALAYISKTISDNTVEYNLTQSIAGASPVITSIEGSWS